MTGEEYPRFLTPGFTPLDPVDLAKRTEEIVYPYHTTVERLRHAGIKLIWL